MSDATPQASTAARLAFDIGARLADMIQRFVTRRGEVTFVIVLLLAFGALWWLFDIVSLATFDVHADVSELSVWTRALSLGNKHPPLSSWIFGLWFALFPRSNAAAYLLAITTVAATLAIVWRLARDQIDFNRTLLGVASLMLVPFFTFQALKFNANMVMMPFWAAALLFFLRAQSSQRPSDALLAGIFAGLAFIGKYWAIYLLAGMGLASLIGPNARAFWKSSAPWLMAGAALLVVGPHLYWLAFGKSAQAHEFVNRVMSPRSFGHDLKTSAFYLVGSFAYIGVPLIFFACLRPSRAALRDTFWPADAMRRQSLVLLALPLLLPAFVNLVLPHRLTPLWTFPNWALLPVVLFGSPGLTAPALAAARAALLPFAVAVAALIVSPWLAIKHLSSEREANRLHGQHLASAIKAMDPHVLRYWGNPDVSEGLSFYLPGTRPISIPPRLADNKDRVARFGVTIICRTDDADCVTQGDDFTRHSPWTDVTLTRRFLGFESPPLTYRIKVIPNPGKT